MRKLKRKISLIAGLMVAALVTVNAQNFQGIATYQSSRKMDDFKVKMDGMTPEMEKQLAEQMKKQFQKEYQLKFNLTESSWKEAESLGNGPATASGGGMRIVMGGSSTSLTYKNTAENLYLREQEVFSKPFLVKDELEPREWEMTSETKQIGNYTAYKAIFTDIRERRVISFVSGDGQKDDGESEIQTDTIKVEAWYTPDIPVSQGPEEYWGLPGLIMEVNDGTTTYICTKVVLNPEEGVNIKRPNKGKRVTREELRAEIEAKSEEMMKKYSNGRGGVSFKIGGGN